MEPAVDWDGFGIEMDALFEEHTTDWDGLTDLFSGLFEDEPVHVAVEVAPDAAAVPRRPQRIGAEQHHHGQEDVADTVNLTSPSGEGEVVSLTSTADDPSEGPLLPFAARHACGFDDEDMAPLSEGEDDI